MNPLMSRTKIWNAALVLFLFSFIILASFVVHNDRSASKEQFARKSFHSAMAGHDEGLAEYSARDKNGRHFPVLIRCSALRRDNGNINCSAVHFKKCLMNLVANGAEAISGTGHVTITSGNARLAKPSLPDMDRPAQRSQKLHPVKKNYCFIQVKDTGKGLSETDTERIFESFYTKKKMGRSGTGLGLTVVWNTMMDHNGWADVENFEGQTIFSLYFPSTTEKSPAQLQQPDWQSFKGNQQSALIIDDEKLQRNIASELLQTLGYNMQSVASGEDAVAYLQTASADVLLLDMLMEPGINGLETYRQICALHPGQRAVIASGYSKSTEVDQTLQLGADAYIPKPYTIEQLGKAIYTPLTQS